MRHAKSSWKHASLTDFERPLNRRGRAAAPVMGTHLKALVGKPDLMVSSPACRAASTARLVAPECGYAASDILYAGLIYDGSVEDIVTLISSLPEDVETCMLIGHNPDFTMLANMLFAANIDNVPTAGVVCGTFECKHWDGVPSTPGALQFYEFPKKLDAEG